MKTYEQIIAGIRQDEEKLTEKLCRLERFIMSVDFTKISTEQQKLLSRQHYLMSELKKVLVQRAYRINFDTKNKRKQKKRARRKHDKNKLQHERHAGTLPADRISGQPETP